MKAGAPKRLIPIVLFACAGLCVLWAVWALVLHRDGPGRAGSAQPAPVEAAEIEHGPITLRRTFSGELEPLAQFVVAPKVSGRVDHMVVNIADSVARGQVVAELDNDEYVQAVAQAQAELEVARANRSAARSAFESADRELKRTASLLKRGIASDSQFDASQQEQLAKQAELQVAEAQVVKADSVLQTANIRLSYTQVTAGWSGGNDTRVVAERYLDEGQNVAANAPLLLIVELDPIIAVVFVTEKEYARLQPGQAISLTTEAYPGEQYTGRIDRIAPIFRQATRQARVEMRIDNSQHHLKPGMFIHATVVLAHAPEAVIVPEQALTLRDDRTGLFVVSQDGRSVHWREVKVGLREGSRVQVEGEGLSGRVITLGQQLINDGSTVTVAAGQTSAADGPKPEAP
ncbi:MAG: efflux RND transporter periplasmic adaptor subunit [Desulfobacterales bacterium]|nr:efflux RND transporter periplasmic adaptor subunit [Desulfobacterales bacterium]